MPQAPRTLRVTAIALNVRDKASTNGAILGQLQENDVVEWQATSSNPSGT